MEEYYLKPTTKMEPLIWRWYAWPYLIPPFTAGCNIVERHLKIMHSYAQNPQIHANAVLNPKLLGGPFIDLEGQRVDEIKELIEKTKADCSILINLNSSLKEFNQILQKEAQGDSLDSLYNMVPESLKGLIELVYDLDNHPSIRIIEPLVYKCYYLFNHQAIVLSETHSDFRKFVLSTPRLDMDNEVYLATPFASTALDELFKMREKPNSLKKIEEILKVPNDKHKLFESLFTTIPPSISQDRNYKGEGVRIRYFGHACMLVQTNSVSIMFDPVISYPIKNDLIPRYTLVDLPDFIDYVIITHNHQDHLMFETLLQIRHKIGHIVFGANNIGSLEDPSIKLILKNIGFSSLIELKEFDSISIKNIEIIALPFLGEHSDLNIQSKLSYCILFRKKKFIFAADSNNLEPRLYDRIFDVIGTIDMLFLGMECEGAPLTWLYGPLLTQTLKRSYDRNRTLSGSNFNKAWSIVKKLSPSHAYIYAMGQEPWLGFMMALQYSKESPQIIESDKFIQACRDNGIQSERLFGKKEWIMS